MHGVVRDPVASLSTLNPLHKPNTYIDMLPPVVLRLERKLLFKLVGGEGDGGVVETVLIPVVREAGQKPRITICVSSQASAHAEGPKMLSWGGVARQVHTQRG